MFHEPICPEDFLHERKTVNKLFIDLGVYANRWFRCIRPRSFVWSKSRAASFLAILRVDLRCLALHADTVTRTVYHSVQAECPRFQPRVSEFDHEPHATFARKLVAHSAIGLSLPYGRYMSLPTRYLQSMRSMEGLPFGYLTDFG